MKGTDDDEIALRILNAVGELVVPYRTICQIVGGSDGRIASALGALEQRGILERTSRGYRKAEPMTGSAPGPAQPTCRKCGVALTDANWYPSLRKGKRYRCKVCFEAHRAKKPAGRTSKRSGPIVAARVVAPLVAVTQLRPTAPLGMTIDHLRRIGKHIAVAVQALEAVEGELG